MNKTLNVQKFPKKNRKSINICKFFVEEIFFIDLIMNFFHKLHKVQKIIQNNLIINYRLFLYKPNFIVNDHI